MPAGIYAECDALSPERPRHTRQNTNPIQKSIYAVPALQNEHGYGEVSTRLLSATALALEAARK